MKNEMEDPKKKATKDVVLNKIKELLVKAGNNLSDEDYSNLVNEIPDIEGLDKEQIRSKDELKSGLKDVNL
jgi:hypothetical protein